MSTGITATGNFWSAFFVNNRIVSGVIIIALYLIIISFFGYMIAPYIKKLYTGENTKLRKYTDPIIGFIEKVAGVDRNKTYSFKGYFISLIIFNFVAGTISFLFLIFQGYFFKAPGQDVMSPSLTFNTIISFLTNTNLQHYSSPTTLTYLDLTVVIIGLMFLSAGTGFAASMAFVRGIMNDDKKLGNFFHDFLVAIFDLILPLSPSVGTISFFLTSTIMPFLSSEESTIFSVVPSIILPVVSFFIFLSVAVIFLLFPSASASPRVEKNMVRNKSTTTEI